MLDTLWLIFKCSLLIFGILVVVSVILSILIEPFKRNKRKKATKEFLDELSKIAKECTDELKKQEKTSVKKPRNTKKKEDK